MTARKIAIAKFFCFSFVLSALCFAPGPAHSQEREKLRVSTLFIGSSLVPLWIAQEQGIFARNGVDVELIWMQSTLSTTALLAGEVDVVFGTPQTILAVLTAKNPPPLVTVAAWGSASEHWLVVNPAIKSAKDLEGKTLGTSRPRSADHGYTILMLERMGIDPRKITFLSTGGQASRSAAVEAGTTMGSSFNRYYMLQLKRKGFRDLAKLERPDYPFPPSIFVVKKDALQSKRRALKAMLLAMMESSERQKNDKELSVKLIRKNLRLQNPEVIDAAYADGVTISYPYFTERQFQVSLELLGKSMGQPVLLNYKQVVDHSLLDELGRPGMNRPG
ncbi:MAG TPA: ABC transporter substrate-binding protein [Candidatus Binatia bacterium]